MVCTALMLACNNQKSSTGTATSQDKATAVAKGGLLSPQDFNTKMAAGNVVVVDVRTPGEVTQGYIKGAKVIDYNGNDFEKQAAVLNTDKNVPVMVYCAAGGRSANAAAIFKKLGYTEVYDLKGGFGAWQSAGMAVEK